MTMHTAARVLTGGTQPEIWMDFTSGFLAASFGTVTVKTPFSIAAFTWSTLESSGSRNLLVKLPWLRSTRCQVSVFSSDSRLLCPLIWRIRPSSTSTFTSSFFSPGTSALKTWEFGVSFQSTLVWRTDDVSAGKLDLIWSENERKLPLNGKPSNGSHKPRENGSKTSDRWGISDIFKEIVWSAETYSGNSLNQFAGGSMEALGVLIGCGVILSPWFQTLLNLETPECSISTRSHGVCG